MEVRIKVIALNPTEVFSIAKGDQLKKGGKRVNLKIWGAAEAIAD